MTTRELRELLAFWQPALRLADWDIEVHARTRKSLNGDDGEAAIYPEIKEAEIGVVSTKPSSAYADHETILVHELLHCYFERLRNDSTDGEVERIVEDLSKAIVRIQRNAAREGG